MRPVFAGVMALLLASCGPTVSQLIAQNQIARAFCRASNEREAATVVPSVLSRIAPEWRVRQVLREDLPALDERLAKDVFDRRVLLIVETRARPQPGLRVRGFDWLASFAEDPSSDRVVGRVAPPLGPEEFASLTGEGGPPATTVTKSELAHPASAIRWAFIPLGFLLLFAERRTTTETRYPSDAELRAAAPRSAALYDALLAKFGRAPAVVLRRGEGTRGFRIEQKLLIDGEALEGCASRLWMTVHGATFSLHEKTASPAGVAWQPFDLRASSGELEPRGPHDKSISVRPM